MDVLDLHLSVRPYISLGVRNGVVVVVVRMGVVLCFLKLPREEG